VPAPGPQRRAGGTRGSALFDPFARPRSGGRSSGLHEWSSDTETGDRDELVPGVGEQAWRQVSVSGRECLGVSRCPIGTDCFAERARADAGKADVVVTNHAMLAINALEGYQVLPSTTWSSWTRRTTWWTG